METLTTFDDAFSVIANHFPKFETGSLPVRQGQNHILAKDAIANINVPPFARSMMDGYALHRDNLTRGTTLTVTGITAAGDGPGQAVYDGFTIRVMTGAPVPPGTAAVIRDEWCESMGTSQVRLLRAVEAGSSVQPAGDDGRRGDVLVGRGTRLSELHLAVLQTFGVTEIQVSSRPRAAIIVTGTELVQDPGQPLTGGQIYGANDTLLCGALEADGVEVAQVVYVADNLQELETVVHRAARLYELVFVTGGVSVGDFDYTPTAIGNTGSTIHLRKVLMRPGSPFLFATRGNTALFGLSGNPAACYAQFCALVRPAIHCALGQPELPFPDSGVLAHDLSLKPIKHTRILRGRARMMEGRLQVDCNLSQSTGVISSFAQTNVFVRLEESQHLAGDIVPLRFVRTPF